MLHQTVKDQVFYAFSLGYRASELVEPMGIDLRDMIDLHEEYKTNPPSRAPVKEEDPHELHRLHMDALSRMMDSPSMEEFRKACRDARRYSEAHRKAVAGMV